MPTVGFTSTLAAHYQDLFHSCQIHVDRHPTVEDTLTKIAANQHRYEAVSAATQVPWYVVALLHNMEASLRFDRHLHNGDPLTARTVHVPAGRPKHGTPPFTWEESAIDALRLKGMHRWTDWSLPGLLYKLEEYNGWGYRRFHPEVLTPYLWSYSNHYTSGKYVADGRWSPSAVSKQCGAAVLLRRMVEKGMIRLPAADGQVSGDVAEAPGTAADAATVPLVRYAPGESSAAAEELQRFLNKVGLLLRVDGKAGEKTSDAFRKLSGYYLLGDPRAG